VWREVNSEPSIAPIANQVAEGGQEMVVAITVQDGDLPPNELTLHLLEGPPGAVLDSARRRFTWTPAESHAGRAWPATVVVRDNGQPPMAAETGFTIRVTPDADQHAGPATSAVDPSAAAVPGSGTGTAQRAADQRFLLFVNLGGEAYEDQEGNPWRKSEKHGARDFGHEGGMSAGKTIQPFPHLLWAETAIRGLTAFRAAVPEGVYEVTLCFCEQWTQDVSRRRFYTVWERGNPHAFRREFQGPGIGGPWTHVERKVLVQDGQLDIEFGPLGEGSFLILSGIIIRQVSGLSATRRRR
jgi:hypothetical protein